MAFDMYEKMERFKRSIIFQFGLSDNTYESYCGDLKRFFDFLQRDPITASKKDVELFFENLRKSNKSKSTISRMIVSIRRFYDFLISEGTISVNPARNLRAPKQEEKSPNPLELSQVKDIFDCARRDLSKSGIRNVAILSIFYSSGLRVSELIGLTVDDVYDSSTCCVRKHFRITGKGGVERVVILSDISMNDIEKYLNIRSELAKVDLCAVGCKWLFPGRPYRTSKSENKFRSISRQRVFQILKSIANSCGLDEKDLSPHILRHSFATHMLKNGMSLRTLQELLGHSEISSTQIYSSVSINDLCCALEKFHPFAENNNKEEV